MEWAAFILLLLTASGGLYLLATWLRAEGIQQRTQPGRRIRPPLILSHFGLAATALVLWIVFLATDSDEVAWAAFGVLVLVAGLGFTMFSIWLQRRQATTAGAATTPGPGAEEQAGAEPAEQRFPVSVVLVHGGLAATTLILVLLAALDVGT